MSQTQEEIDLVRDVNATLIPHGEDFILSKGERVTITHRLGGNFTVMTLNGMYRIAAKDADALGEKGEEFTEENHPIDAEPANEEKIRDNLRTVFDPDTPENVIELGLIYKIQMEQV